MNEQVSDTQRPEAKRVRTEHWYTWVEDNDGHWQISSRGFITGTLSMEAQEQRRTPAILGGESADAFRVITRSQDSGKKYVSYLSTGTGSIAIDVTGYVRGRLTNPEQALQAWEQQTGLDLKEQNHEA